MGALPRVLVVLVAALLPLTFLSSPSSALDGVPGVPAVPELPELPWVPGAPVLPDLEPVPGVRVDPPGESQDFPRLPSHCYDENDVITSPCRITTYAHRPWLVLWGDSHAQMYLPSVRKLAKRKHVNLVAVLFGGCPISVPFPASAGLPRTGCDNHNVDSLAYVRGLVARKSRVRILVNGFWSGYRHAYELVQEEQRTGVPSGLSDYRKHMARLGVERSRMMFGRIGELGAPVDLVDQAATVPLDPRTCATGREPYQCDLPRPRAMYDEGGNLRWLRRNLIARLPVGGRLIDPSPSYCSATTCFAHVDGANTFYDDIHLSATLTSTMTTYFAPTFTALLEQPLAR